LEPKRGFFGTDNGKYMPALVLKKGMITVVPLKNGVFTGFESIKNDNLWYLKREKQD
jgi:hypothetical protein